MTRNRSAEYKADAALSKVAQREQRKLAGLCPRCADVPTPGFVYCAPCRADNTVRLAKYRLKFNEGKKAARNGRKARGDCIMCGKVPVTRFNMCGRCRISHSKTRQARRLVKKEAMA